MILTVAGSNPVIRQLYNINNLLWIYSIKLKDFKMTIFQKNIKKYCPLPMYYYIKYFIIIVVLILYLLLK